jgi:hypothetical protein
MRDRPEHAHRLTVAEDRLRSEVGVTIFARESNDPELLARAESKIPYLKRDLERVGGTGATVRIQRADVPADRVQALKTVEALEYDIERRGLHDLSVSMRRSLRELEAAIPASDAHSRPFLEAQTTWHRECLKHYGVRQRGHAPSASTQTRSRQRGGGRPRGSRRRVTAGRSSGSSDSDPGGDDGPGEAGNDEPERSDLTAGHPRSRFGFAELHARTPDLSGPERAEVFNALPDVLQDQAWADLREHADYRSHRDFEDWCRDGK